MLGAYTVEFGLVPKYKYRCFPYDFEIFSYSTYMQITRLILFIFGYEMPLRLGACMEGCTRHNEVVAALRGQYQALTRCNQCVVAALRSQYQESTGYK